MSEDSDANKAERENVPVSNKFPELHNSVHEHTEFLTGGGGAQSVHAICRA